jgi:hypothetical protein
MVIVVAVAGEEEEEDWDGGVRLWSLVRWHR